MSTPVIITTTLRNIKHGGLIQLTIIVTAGELGSWGVVCAASSPCLICSHTLSLGLCNENTAELPLRVNWLSLMLRFVQRIGFSN